MDETSPPGTTSTNTPRSSLPSLGRRGEGWVAIQGVLIVVMALTGWFGPRWPEAAQTYLWIAAIVFGVVGLALFLGGSQRLGRQLTPFPRPVDDSALKQDGAYHFVRHPIYGGVLLLALAWALASSPLAFMPWLLACPFLELKSRREEAWLTDRHPRYAEYRRLVRHRFVPFVW
jgi:protein-S-isoprenylcysteine O-methyltransferase Ste14